MKAPSQLPDTLDWDCGAVCVCVRARTPINECIARAFQDEGSRRVLRCCYNYAIPPRPLQCWDSFWDGELLCACATAAMVV